MCTDSDNSQKSVFDEPDAADLTEIFWDATQGKPLAESDQVQQAYDNLGPGDLTTAEVIAVEVDTHEEIVLGTGGTPSEL